MNFAQFRAQFQENPLILSRDIMGRVRDQQTLRNQFSRWEKKGLLISLRRGVYLLNKSDRRKDVDINRVANVLYEPSYLSLEYALNFYGIIPERVAAMTSVSTRKTARFSNELGVFTYQRIKPVAFRGFKKVGTEEKSFFIAEPEKAVVDFLYLNLSQFGNKVRDTRSVLEHSYRFQNIEELNSSRLKAMARLLENKKLLRVVKDLCGWIEEVKS